MAPNAGLRPVVNFVFDSVKLGEDAIQKKGDLTVITPDFIKVAGDLPALVQNLSQILPDLQALVHEENEVDLVAAVMEKFPNVVSNEHAIKIASAALDLAGTCAVKTKVLIDAINAS